MNIASYMLAAGLIQEGMSPWQAVMTVLLGNLIVLVPMLLIGHAGAKHGIPYAVLVRASFGTQGAKLPALLRAIVACGWYGIQTYRRQRDLYAAEHPDRQRTAARRCPSSASGSGSSRASSCSGRCSSTSSGTAPIRSAGSRAGPRRSRS